MFLHDHDEFEPLTEVLADYQDEEVPYDRLPREARRRLARAVILCPLENWFDDGWASAVGSHPELTPITHAAYANYGIRNITSWMFYDNYAEHPFRQILDRKLEAQVTEQYAGIVADLAVEHEALHVTAEQFASLDIEQRRQLSDDGVPYSELTDEDDTATSSVTAETPGSKPDCVESGTLTGGGPVYRQCGGTPIGHSETGMAVYRRDNGEIRVVEAENTDVLVETSND